ncbi:protein kinase domain-containing protein [Candidatus Leptofilum sp.]|uniref:protein kinase domain-containing protein n=1 Tax=Candidatus Leptofilum sp. TaxID=3241576 RepID=UPI003B5910B9
MSLSKPESLPGKIGRYEIESLLGRGGMAVVYLAFDPFIDRPVAIKLLLKDRSYDENLRSRFKRESRMVASLNHPAIVPVYDFGEEDEQPYLVMRYMEGGSLREKLRAAPLALQEVAAILNQIAPALDTTHAHKIIHRDLKPSNILFDAQGKAYLADFGLAKFAEGTYTTLTRNDGMVGTPAYMSPEQIRAQPHLDGRTDIYALGVILFEMLAGRLPFSANGRLPIALMHLSDPVPAVHTLNLSLPESISPVIAKAMAKKREDRFARASELTAPFVKAAEVETLPPVQFTNAPPIILQPDSESGSSTWSSLSGSSENQPELPEWLQLWLADYGTKQDIGRSRTRGTLEDRMRVGNVQTVGGLHLLLAIVSDGSSSQQHGHLAAELVINELFNRIEQSETAVPHDIPEMLQVALQQTNRTLFSVAQQHREPLVMQSMVALVVIHDNRLFMAHVGNGRIFLLRNRKLHQLNRPVPPAMMNTNGQASYSNGQTGHSSAIGVQPDLTVDLSLYLKSSESEAEARKNQGLQLQANDRLLLCSDGLLPPHQRQWRRRFRRVLSENAPVDAAKILVQDAVARQVTDNVTAVVLQAPGTKLHVPIHLRQPFQMATAAVGTVLLIALLLIMSSRPQPAGVFVPPGTATQIAQILTGLTATAVNNPAQAAIPTQIPPLIAPEQVPDPGFAVIFAAGEGAEFRPSGSTSWQAARAGDLVQIGADAAIRSGGDRMGVVLSDGAELYLASEAELMLNGVYQSVDDATATQVSLTNGRLLIHYNNADPHDFELQVPTNAMALLSTDHNVAGVIYDAETAVLELDCFVGSCLLRNSQNRQLKLPAGRYATTEGPNITTLSTARQTLYCDLAPTLVACPTPTPAPTQTLPPIVETVIAATETAGTQTATPLSTQIPSPTPTPQPTASVTPLPTVTPQPGATDSPPAATNTATSQPNPTSLPTASATPLPATSTPIPSSTPSNTPLPTNTNTPLPSPTSTIRFTASPPPTFTPTKDPNT